MSLSYFLCPEPIRVKVPRQTNGIGWMVAFSFSFKCWCSALFPPRPTLLLNKLIQKRQTGLFCVKLELVRIYRRYDLSVRAPQLQ